MKRSSPHLTHLIRRLQVCRVALAALAGVLLTGCLFRPATVSTRHFVLTPISTNQPAGDATDHLSVGIAFVKLPPSLLRSSMAVRNGANELAYLDDARWAERLDRCFERTLAANLSELLPSDRIYLDDWERDQVIVKLSVNVQRFEVDTSGRGTLVAQWRITAPNSDATLKFGRTRLERTGASPHGKPEVVAATLSDLEAEFSRQLAPSIRASAEKLARTD